MENKKIYKTEIIKSIANINKRANKIEEKINEMSEQGWEFISVCETPNFASILVFRK